MRQLELDYDNLYMMHEDTASDTGVDGSLICITESIINCMNRIHEMYTSVRYTRVRPRNEHETRETQHILYNPVIIF
jgi:hypothetical protein